MTAYLGQQSYGKSNVRLTKLKRDADPHEMIEMSVDIELDGEFEHAYTMSDNSMVIPTDTIKNTIYAFARELDPFDTETFVWSLGAHFIETYPHVTSAVVRAATTPWQRVVTQGEAHPHAFIGGSSERWLCEAILVEGDESEEPEGMLRGGIEGLTVLKTTGSGFAGFLKDEFTTLPETDDRIMASTIKASWSYNDAPEDWQTLRGSIRQTLIEKFVSGFSPSVQSTLFAMGEAVLELDPIIEDISLSLPNQHRLLVNLEPLGLENPNILFVPTSEPYGDINAVITRTPVHEHECGDECDHE